MLHEYENNIKLDKYQIQHNTTVSIMLHGNVKYGIVRKLYMRTARILLESGDYCAVLIDNIKYYGKSINIDPKIVENELCKRKCYVGMRITLKVHGKKIHGIIIKLNFINATVQYDNNQIDISYHCLSIDDQYFKIDKFQNDNSKIYKISNDKGIVEGNFEMIFTEIPPIGDYNLIRDNIKFIYNVRNEKYVYNEESLMNEVDHNIFKDVIKDKSSTQLTYIRKINKILGLEYSYSEGGCYDSKTFADKYGQFFNENYEDICIAFELPVYKIQKLMTTDLLISLINDIYGKWCGNHLFKNKGMTTTIKRVKYTRYTHMSFDYAKGKTEIFKYYKDDILKPPPFVKRDNHEEGKQLASNGGQNNIVNHGFELNESKNVCTTKLNIIKNNLKVENVLFANGFEINVCKNEIKTIPIGETKINILKKIDIPNISLITGNENNTQINSLNQKQYDNYLRKSEIVK